MDKFALGMVFLGWLDCFDSVGLEIVGELPESGHFLVKQLLIGSYTRQFDQLKQVLPEGLLRFANV